MNDLPRILKAMDPVFSEASIDTVVNTLLKIILDETEAELSMIEMYSLDGGERKKLYYQLNTENSPKALSIDAEELWISRRVLKMVWKNKDVVLSMDAMNDDRFISSTSIPETDLSKSYIHGVLSMVCVPLIYEEEIFGVLYIDNRNRLGVFTSETANLLKNLADLLVKPLRESLNNALLREETQNQFDIQIQQVLKEVEENDGYQELIGKSHVMMGVYARLEGLKGIKRKLTILIQGESGTGKELLAMACHQNIRGENEPFEAINCATIKKELFESELFGHKKGSFTGAFQDQKGLFELARGGTIFLDEIGELPLDMQAKLLRVLQENKIRPTGAAKEIDVDVLVICATNRDLSQMTKEGMFREDLYYRIRDRIFNLPPLKERGEDIMLLAGKFLKKINEEEAGNVDGFSHSAKEMLANYPYPGNVRELKGIIIKAFYNKMVMKKDEKVIDTIHLPEEVRKDNKMEIGGNDFEFHKANTAMYTKYVENNSGEPFIGGLSLERDGNSDSEQRMHEKIMIRVDKSTHLLLKPATKAVGEAFERNYIIDKLIQNKGQILKTSEDIGIDKKTLIQKMKRHGLKKEWYY